MATESHAAFFVVKVGDAIRSVNGFSMAQGRSYNTGIRAALASLSRGSCYWPHCGEPVIRFVQGTPVANLQIAHIHALERGGPRYRESMTSEERNSFGNLILLCHPHHVVVDKKSVDKFPPGLLFKWKQNREASGQSSLSGLRNVTEEQLEKLLSAAISEQSKRLDDAVSKLEELDSESAQAIRELISEVDRLRRSSSFLDPDSINTLYAASGRLSGYLDPDVVNNLMKASETLMLLNIPDLATQLSDAARRISRAQEMM